MKPLGPGAACCEVGLVYSANTAVHNQLCSGRAIVWLEVVRRLVVDQGLQHDPKRNSCVTVGCRSELQTFSSWSEDLSRWQQNVLLSGPCIDAIGARVLWLVVLVHTASWRTQGSASTTVPACCGICELRCSDNGKTSTLVSTHQRHSDAQLQTLPLIALADVEVPRADRRHLFSVMQDSARSSRKRRTYFCEYCGHSGIGHARYYAVHHKRHCVTGDHSDGRLPESDEPDSPGASAALLQPDDIMVGPESPKALTDSSETTSGPTSAAASSGDLHSSNSSSNSSSSSSSSNSSHSSSQWNEEDEVSSDCSPHWDGTAGMYSVHGLHSSMIPQHEYSLSRRQ